MHRLHLTLLAATLLAPVLPAAQAATACGPAQQPGLERCVTGLPAATIAAMHQVQRASQWCWAASISMVLARYGIAVDQEQVVRAHFGAVADQPVPQEAVAQLLNRDWRDARGQALQASAAPLPRWRKAAGLAAPEVLEELDAGRPLLVGANQHAMVLVQLVYERPLDPAAGPLRLLRAVVLDPAQAVGVRSLKPAEREPTFLARVRVEPLP